MNHYTVCKELNATTVMGHQQHVSATHGYSYKLLNQYCQHHRVPFQDLIDSVSERPWTSVPLKQFIGAPVPEQSFTFEEFRPYLEQACTDYLCQKVKAGDPSEPAMVLAAIDYDNSNGETVSFYAYNVQVKSIQAPIDYRQYNDGNEPFNAFYEYLFSTRPVNTGLLEDFMPVTTFTLANYLDWVKGRPHAMSVQTPMSDLLAAFAEGDTELGGDGLVETDGIGRGIVLLERPEELTEKEIRKIFETVARTIRQRHYENRSWTKLFDVDSFIARAYHIVNQYDNGRSRDSFRQFGQPIFTRYGNDPQELRGLYSYIYDCLASEKRATIWQEETLLPFRRVFVEHYNERFQATEEDLHTPLYLIKSELATDNGKLIK